MENKSKQNDKAGEKEIDRRLNTEVTWEKLKTPKSKFKELKTLADLKKEKR